MEFEPPPIDDDYDKLDDDQGEAVPVTSTTFDDVVATETEESSEQPATITPELPKEIQKDDCHTISMCDIVYWRAPLRSAIILSNLLILQVSLMCCSLISVVSYIGLCVSLVSISFCLYKQIIGQENPFQSLISSGPMIPEVCVSKTFENVAVQVNKGIAKLTPFVLVENYVSTLKFMFVLWIGTYIGSCFNFLTLLMLATIGAFAAPRIYEDYKTQIDEIINLALQHVYKAQDMVKEKIKTLPIVGQKEKSS